MGNTNYTYKQFEDTDIVAGKTKIKTFPMWSDSPSDADVNPEFAMTTFFTQSAETALWEGNYYYNVYAESTSSNYNAPVQFSVSYGTNTLKELLHENEEYRYTYPSYAVYRQMISTVSPDGVSSSSFTFPTAVGSATYVTSSNAYFISIARSRMKDEIDKDMWQLNLSGSSGLLNLINQPNQSIGATVIPIISGTISTYTGTVGAAGSAGEIFGLFYPKHGLYVLDANRIHTIIGGAPVTSSIYSPTGALSGIFNAISGGQYFSARTVESVKTTHYFCRIKNFEFNKSTNDTYTDSDGNILSDFASDPITYITTVGLYDGDKPGEGSLVAVAKLSRPIQKTSDSEALIKVMLQF